MLCGGFLCEGLMREGLLCEGLLRAFDEVHACFAGDYLLAIKSVDFCRFRCFGEMLFIWRQLKFPLISKTIDKRNFLKHNKKTIDKITLLLPRNFSNHNNFSKRTSEHERRWRRRSRRRPRRGRGRRRKKQHFTQTDVLFSGNEKTEVRRRLWCDDSPLFAGDCETAEAR
jgi:hypothetical protein